MKSILIKILNNNFDFKFEDTIFGKCLCITNFENSSFNFNEIKIPDMEIKIDKILIPETHFIKNNILLFSDFKNLFDVYPSYFTLKEENKEVFLFDKKMFLDAISEPIIKKYKDLEFIDKLLYKVKLKNRKSEKHTLSYEIIHKKMIVINNSISYDNLNNLDKRIIVSIKTAYKRFISRSQLDKEIRLVFFKKAIEDTFNRNYITFDDVILNIDNLLQQYEIISRAYIEELDTEKVKYDYEKRLQEYNEKLSSMVGDIHTKQIMFPIAFVIGVAQIDKVSSTQFVLIILFGLLIFATILTFYSNTQKNLIKVLEDNIQYWEEFYKKNLNTLYKSEIENKIFSIKEIISKVKNNINYSVLLSWVLIIVFFIYITFKYL